MQHPEEDLRAFIGPRADYYLQAWSGIDPAGGPQPTRWSWPAFLLNLLWMLYRRMYKYFWIAFGALLALAILQVVVQVSFRMTNPWPGIILNFAVSVSFGMFGNWLYYRHAMSTIARTKAYHTSPEAIARAGGVRFIWIVLLFIVPMIVGILAAIIVPLMMKKVPGVAA